MTGSNRTITIVGGGLAGLSLGIALRHSAIEVEVIEAGSYPRHKVCGEFLSGAAQKALDQIPAGDIVSAALRHSTISWFAAGAEFRSDTLPGPALGLSRYQLDAALAKRFQELGGRLRTSERWSEPRSGKGLVWAAGRSAEKTQWIGLKCHCRDFKLSSDLEMHLGNDGYAGASAVEDGRVNVCGLFRLRTGARASPDQILSRYLRDCGMEDFADRVEQGDPDPDSRCAVAALSFGHVSGDDSCIRIGDAFALIPPFTGDGMSMAFESAVLAKGPIVSYASGAASWEQAARLVRRRLGKRFRIRLGAAAVLHQLMLRRSGRGLFRFATRAGLVPFSHLFRLLH